MTPPRAALTVDRARVTAATPASRAHLETALARVSPAAVGVPDGALLVVRRLASRVRLGSGMRADAFVADLQETLRARLAHARRPGAAGDDDDLLFLDDAELAAAIVASWLAGDPPATRRWRRIVTGDSAPPRWWRDAVLSDARLLPRVVAALARHGLAAAWIAALDPADVAQATRMLAAAHGVARADAIAQIPAPAAAPRRASAARRRADAILVLVPEAAAPTLAEPARALLALALTLERRASLATTPAFARALSAIATAPPPDARQTTPPPRADRAIDAADAPRRAGPVDAASSRARLSPGHAAPPIAAPIPDRPAAPAAAIETRFGGVAFVLNALVALDLYGDFTAPAHATPGLSPSDLLALLGRRWFGARFRRDPIDRLLATLAGRPEDERPARHFTPPPWRVPDAWLAPWPDATPDFPLQAPPARWVASLALYLRARLARALDVSPTRAVSLTCRHPAAVALSGDRVTFTYALATHPLPLRLAGLDRDPGWLPAARRDVRFVFA